MKERKKKHHVIGGQKENVILKIPDFSVGASLALRSRRGLFIFKALLGLNIKNKLWRTCTFTVDPTDPVTNGTHRVRHHWSWSNLMFIWVQNEISAMRLKARETTNFISVICKVRLSQ